MYAELISLHRHCTHYSRAKIHQTEADQQAWANFHFFFTISATMLSSLFCSTLTAHLVECSTKAFLCVCVCVCLCVASKIKIIMLLFFIFNGLLLVCFIISHFFSSRLCVCVFVRAHLFPVNITNVVVILPITLDTCFFLMNKRPGTITLIQITNLYISFYSLCYMCVSANAFFFHSFDFQMNFNLALLRAKCNLVVQYFIYIVILTLLYRVIYSCRKSERDVICSMCMLYSWYLVQLSIRSVFRLCLFTVHFIPFDSLSLSF